MTTTSNLRGIAFMALATGAYVANDTFMKLATVGLPPFEVVFLRGLMATAWCLPLVLFTGNGPKIAGVVNGWLLLRNSFELMGILCFIVALKNLPIADVTALGQIAPMLLLIGVALIYGDRIGVVRMVLIAVGFGGALLVAQPSGAGFSVYALLGLGAAVGPAIRDIVGRKVPAAVPSLIVAFSTVLVVLVGSGVVTFAFETWVAPDASHLIYLACSGLLLTAGHFFIFLSYRTGATGAVAPFYYLFSVWAVISGVVVFQTLPNALALAGIALILGSGVMIALLDERKRRLLITA